MTEKEEKHLLETVERIERAVSGEPKTGLTGLVKRMAAVERKLGKLELRFAVAAMGGLTIGKLIEKFWKQ